MAKLRGFPAVGSGGKKWSGLHVLGPSIKARVRQHKVALNKKEGLLGVSQNAGWSSLTTHMPALLKRTV
eukprot:10980420-Alexandrium_andersonii.AAC.1